ncbi:MAG: hypothetical protein IPO27_03145 [Bacteroidetes bacterium]|nr:hypothetical protein [Bacteroidota bacterium]
MFILKLDASGNFAWAKKLDGLNFISCFSLIADGTLNVYISGYFTIVCNFDPGVSNFTLNGAGSNFISKFDQAGNFAWAVPIAGSIFSSTVDASKNVITTGSFSGTRDFDQTAATFNLTSFGVKDVFIHKNEFGLPCLRCTN